MRGACFGFVGELSEPGVHGVPRTRRKGVGALIDVGSEISAILRVALGFRRIGFRALLGSFL